jgi:hypothetical protein
MRILEENKSTHFNFDFLNNNIQRVTSNLHSYIPRCVSDARTDNGGGEGLESMLGVVNQSVSPR